MNANGLFTGTAKVTTADSNDCGALNNTDLKVSTCK
jgi:hypothetical protein